MNKKQALELSNTATMDAPFILFGGIAGAAGVVAYVTGIAMDLEPALGLLAIAMFCILSIISSMAIREAIADGTRSRLADIGLLFSVAAFSTLLAMISVQLAVRAHAKSVLDSLAGEQKETFLLAVQLARRVDWGLDVAWDLLGGVFLLAFGVAMCKARHFRALWGAPLALLAAALLVLNLWTFPVPPASAGLFDIGPFIGLYMLALNVRMITIGARALRRKSTPHAAVIDAVS